ncbi:MAG: hypothetical protein AB1846_08935 [Chloroflexota bacterium]
MPPFTFNGKTYNDPAEMPADERLAYEQLMKIFKDENQDGVPDIFQGDVLGNLLKAATTTVIVDGKPVSGLDGLSPEMRIKVQEGMEKLREMGFISEVPLVPGYSQMPQSAASAEIRPSPPLIQSPSAIEEDTPRRGFILLFLAMILLAGLAGAVLFLMAK